MIFVLHLSIPVGIIRWKRMRPEAAGGVSCSVKSIIHEPGITKLHLYLETFIAEGNVDA
jgi:hypothetical protein